MVRYHNNLENTAMANGASDCGEEARRRSLRRRLALNHRQIKARAALCAPHSYII